VHNCPDGWHTFQDYCYQFNAHPNQKTTWNNARQECLNFNQPWKATIDVAKADLVSISSSEEQNFVENTFRIFGINYVGDAFWTGFHKNNSKFTWTDHSIITYQNWKNKASKSTNNCTKSSISIYDQGWEPADCTEKNYFVCKVKRGKNGSIHFIFLFPYHYFNKEITTLFSNFDRSR